VRVYRDIGIALLVLYISAVCAGAGETELSWDDGSGGWPEDSIHGIPTRLAAVLFIAPPDAVAVTRFRVYADYDSCTDIGFPLPRGFAVRVWTPNLGTPPMPYEPVGGAALSGEEYIEQAWSVLDLPAPVPLDNEEYFPSGWFFAVLEWSACEPALGIDSDSAASGMSRLRPGDGSESWDVYSGDFMIRAVVVDSLDTPVEIQSWGAVKAEYR